MRNLDTNDANDMKIWESFKVLYKDVQNIDILYDKERRPLLAHYTSIQTIEKIITSEELWLSKSVIYERHRRIAIWIDYRGRDFSAI